MSVRMFSPDLGDGQLASFCVHGVVPSGSVNARNFLSLWETSGFARMMAVICRRRNFEKINFEKFCTPNKISANYSWRLNFTRWRMGFKWRATLQNKFSPVKKLHKLPVRSRTFLQCWARTVERLQKQSHTPYTIGLWCTEVKSLNRNAMKLRRWQAPWS